tara:strand:- start:43 stop:711 length:669 start_codon:yes stop_codon:yes gene_type:complete
MKNILFTLALLISFVSFGQTPTYNVNVTQQKSVGESFSDGMKAGAAARSARAREGAARSAALSNNSKTITTDFLINNDDIYKAVAVNKVSGWKPSANKKSIRKILKPSKKYYYYNNISDIPQNLTNSDKVLYLDWIREAITEYDRMTTMILKDYSGKIVYEASYKNIPYSEMLSPLTTTYVMNKADAIAKIKELKELLDMGILNKEEFQKATQGYKKIILKQ